MWRKFLKHRVAVISSVILIFLYTVVIFANFFAPYGMLTSYKFHTYAPPQITKINFFDKGGKRDWTKVLEEDTVVQLEKIFNQTIIKN